MTRISSLLLIITAVCINGLPSRAEEDCKALLSHAASAYRDSDFQTVKQLEGCLGAFTGDQRKKALILLTRAWLAWDRADKAKEMAALLIDADPNYRAAPDDPSRFRDLIQREQLLRESFQARSISKTNENILDAPAMVVVLEAEDLKTRGYLNLEEVLQELPGFSFTRLEGREYSMVYARGYKGSWNNHLLLRIDGVEQNNLISNSITLSRQYPISGIERITVVYGPVSSIYGPNAYNGVIDVSTHHTATHLEHRFWARAQLTGGDLETRLGDVSLGGPIASDSSWALTARAFQSEVEDLSSYPEWNQFDAQQSFQDHTDDWYLSGTISFARFNAGFQIWSGQEGAASEFTDYFYESSRLNGVHLNQYIFFANYRNPIPRGEIFFTTNYHDNDFNLDNTVFTVNHETSYFYMQASRLKAELGLSQKFGPVSLVGGIELRMARLPFGYYKCGNSQLDDSCEFLDANFFWPPQLGSTEEIIEVGEFTHIEDSNLGLYLQGTWTYGSVTGYLGARFETSRTREFQEFSFDDTLSPRLALVYHPRSLPDMRFKVIYSKAFRNAPPFELIETPFANDGHITNLEAIALYHRENMELTLSIYQSAHREKPAVVSLNASQFFRDSDISGFQLTSRFKAESWSFYGNASYTHAQTDRGVILRVSEQIRVPSRQGPDEDIPDWSLNLGMDYQKGRWTYDLRTKYVSKRKTIVNQDVEPGFEHYPTLDYAKIPAVALVHATLTARLRKDTRLQLIGRNILDQETFHPGIEGADGRFDPIRVPQPGRSLYLNLEYAF